MLPSPRRQIKQLKKTSNTSHDNRQILISASPITTHRSEICRTFLRGNPRAFIEKDRIMKMLKRVVRFSLSRCKWTHQKQKQMRNTSFSERLRRSNLYLNCACKSPFSISLWPVFIAYYSCYHPKKNLSLLSREFVYM